MSDDAADAADAEDDAVTAQEVAAELLPLVIDYLVPAAGHYRDQLARRLGTRPPGLSVLERVRRRPTSAARIAGWTAMTPSAMAKVIRRLEADGHVVRVPSDSHEQELMVELAAHEERDRLLEASHEQVRRALQHLAAVAGIGNDRRLHVAVQTIIQIAAALDERAAAMEARAARREMLARRYRAREAAGLHRW